MTNVYGFILISSYLIQLVTGLLLVMVYSPTASYNNTFNVIVAIGIRYASLRFAAAMFTSFTRSTSRYATLRSL